MKQNDLQRDMAFGQVVMITATPDQDMKQNTDYVIGSLNVAYRRRRLSVKKYRQISIRYKRHSGASTEADKILGGLSRAHLYIQEFEDAWVVCLLTDINKALSEGQGEIVPNRDGLTEAIYFDIATLPHLLIKKDT